MDWGRAGVITVRATQAVKSSRLGSSDNAEIQENGRTYHLSNGMVASQTSVGRTHRTLLGGRGGGDFGFERGNELELGVDCQSSCHLALLSRRVYGWIRRWLEDETPKSQRLPSLLRTGFEGMAIDTRRARKTCQDNADPVDLER